MNPDGSELKEVLVTKVTVACFTSDYQVCEEHVFDLVKGMKFYITNDGYADQFLGDKDKKYRVKNMKNFELKYSYLAFENQKVNLEEEFLLWLG